MRKLILLLSLFASTTAVFAQQPAKVVADKIVGIVGDRIILYSDIRNALADAARQGQPVTEGSECVIMEQALISKVLMLQAIKDSLPVTDEDVEAELDQKLRYYVQQYGSIQELERIANKTVYQIKDDARENVRENKLAQAMQRKIVDGVRITPTEVKAYFDKFPQDSLPFFETEVEIGQIVLYPKASTDMDAYVISELNNYKKQIETGLVTFDQAAKRYSEDPGSKDRGGQYQINRNEKSWDPSFMQAAFRLKDGQISNVFKSKFGYHIIQMVQRNGDDAIVRHILKIPSVTDTETQASVRKLDSIRSNIVAGKMDFATAAGKHTEDEQAPFVGPFILSRDGDTYNAIDELEKDIVNQLTKLQVGEISQPITYVDERGKKAVRVLFLKSKSEPHRLNLRDDYNKVASAALEEKKYKALEKWLQAHLSAYYMLVDKELEHCPQVQKWVNANKGLAAK